MAGPRHLWSGDWESESAPVAEQLPQGRGIGEPAEFESEPVRSGPHRFVMALVAGLLKAALAIAAWGVGGAPQLAGSVRRFAGRARRWFAATGPRTRAAVAALLAAVAAFTIVAAVSGPNPNDRGRPWLGIELANSPIVIGGFTSASGVQLIEGVEVTGVVRGGPAAGVGIQPGDVIEEVGHRPASSPEVVQLAVAHLRVGDRVELRYVQGIRSEGSLWISRAQITLRARPVRHP